MSEEPKARERKVYVPLRGTHVEPPPIYEYSSCWCKERGLKFRPDTRLKKLARWTRRTLAPVFELDREEGFFRIWRLFICWKHNA